MALTQIESGHCGRHKQPETPTGLGCMIWLKFLEQDDEIDAAVAVVAFAVAP